MSDTEQSQQDNNTNNPNSGLDNEEKLHRLRTEYLAVQELVKEKQRKIEGLNPQSNKLEAHIFDLTEYRDGLNATIRKQRKTVEQTEAQLTYEKSKLINYEKAVLEARKNVEKAKRDAKPFFNLVLSARVDLLNAQKMLNVAFEDLKTAQKEYILTGGSLTSEDKSIRAPQTTSDKEHSNPWLSGTFYLFVLVVAVGIIVYLNYLSIPWYTSVVVISVSVLVLLIIAALQLRNDKNLSEENFMKLILEVIKKLPLLKKD